MTWTADEINWFKNATGQDLNAGNVNGTIKVPDQSRINLDKDHPEYYKQNGMVLSNPYGDGSNTSANVSDLMSKKYNLIDPATGRPVERLIDQYGRGTGDILNSSKVKYDPYLGVYTDFNNLKDTSSWLDKNGSMLALAAIGGMVGAGALAAGAGTAGGATAAGAGTTAAGTTAADFALADAAQLAGQGLTQSEIAAVMNAGGIQGTGGMFAGTGGFFGTSGNALADGAINGALRGAVTNTITGGDPLSGGAMGAVTGGWGAAMPDTGNAFANGALKGIPSAVASGSPTGMVTGAVGGGLTQATGSGLVGSTGAALVGNAMTPDKAAPAQRAQTTQTTQPSQRYIML